MEKRPKDFRYITSAGWWTRELLMMFVVGLVLATMLWLGLWFFHVKPIQAAELQAEKMAVESCLVENSLCDRMKDKLETENKEISRQLDEAHLGWGRCIRSKSTPED
jgi:hypothetical protein